MKKISKLILFAMLLLALILIPNLCNAATETVSNSADFIEKVSQAETGDTIELNGNIALTGPIEISDKNLTINGNGHTISRDASWSVPGTNATFITAGGTGTTVTLNNVTLTGSLKYGVQAYNGGHLILNGVTISDCAYAGVLINGGTIEVIDLNLGHNHEPDNIGIEIGMGQDVTTTPKLVMNGAITTDETENVIYLAENDELTGFDVENTDDSEQKIFVQGNQVVVTDAENKVLYTSNETEVELGGNDYVENKTITLHINNKTISFSVPPSTTVTKTALEELIDLDALGVSNYTIEGYYTTAEFTTAFDFNTPITDDTDIYVKLTEVAVTPAPEATTPQKDTTPKTGDSSYVNIAIAVVALSIVGIALLKRKEF